MLHRRIYNVVVFPLLLAGVRLLSPFSRKVMEGLQGRQGLPDRVRAFRTRVGDRPIVLFHCASAGEIESIKPVAAKYERPQTAVALSYFSPSARSALKSGGEFDFADYAPLDRRDDVEQYLDTLCPAVIAIVKHDVWPNLVWSAKDRGIPLLLVNGNFHSRSLKMFPGARSFHRSVYSAFDELMAVSPEDADRARRISGSEVVITSPGDSRYDRVTARAAECRPLPKTLEQKLVGRTVLIAGSTHREDEELLIPTLVELRRHIPTLITVIIPHDPSTAAKGRIASLAARVGVRIVDLEDEQSDSRADLMLVNRSGMLADIYRLGIVAYVGGGFGRGVHSVLEPMAFGLPVFCGPQIHVSHEARSALREDILRVVQSRRQLARHLESWLQDNEDSRIRRRRVIEFVDRNVGAADRIRDRIRNYSGV